MNPNQQVIAKMTEDYEFIYIHTFNVTYYDETKILSICWIPIHNFINSKN